MFEDCGRSYERLYTIRGPGRTDGTRRCHTNPSSIVMHSVKQSCEHSVEAVGVVCVKS